MIGEKDLNKLLTDMHPELNAGVFVFCKIESSEQSIVQKSIAHFKEKEGVTVILSKSEADEYGLDYEFEAAWITLTVHSALEAVGLTAEVAKVMTDCRISCNVVAGYHHDHLFVPYDKAHLAMEALQGLSREGVVNS